MTELFKAFLASALGEYYGITVTVSLSAVAFSCVLETLISLFAYGYGIKKRIRFFLVAVSAVILQAAAENYGGNSAFTSVTLVICLLLSSIVLSVPVRTKKITEKQRELARFIDGKIKSAAERSLEEEEPKDILVKEKTDYCPVNSRIGKERSDAVEILKTVGKKEERRASDLDIGHIRAVLSRLDYYGLSSADKRIINELNYSLNEAERGNVDLETKEKINDGLGALLKIMSKYGA